MSMRHRTHSPDAVPETSADTRMPSCNDSNRRSTSSVEPAFTAMMSVPMSSGTVIWRVRSRISPGRCSRSYTSTVNGVGAECGTERVYPTLAERVGRRSSLRALDRGECLLVDGERSIDLLGRHDARRYDVQAVVGDEGQQSPRHEFALQRGDDRSGDGVVAGCIVDQVEGPEDAESAHLADHRMPLGEGPQAWPD